MLLKIDQEFKNLIPPLTHDERELLEKNIIKEGCRDPIVIWDNIILDGHNRYDICNEHGMPFKVSEVGLDNRNEAINWIIDNQLGRRNVPQQVKVFLIGKRKKQETKITWERENQHTKDVVGVQLEPIAEVKTVTKIAEQNKVSESTVKRAEAYTNAIEKIAESSGKSVMDILTTTKITQEDAKRVSNLAPEIQKEIVDKVTSGESKTFKAVFDDFASDEIINETIIEEPEEKYPKGCGIFIPRKSEIILCPNNAYGYCDINEKWYTEEQYNQLKD